VTLSRSGGLNHRLAAAASALLGAFGIVWAVVGPAGAVVAVLGALLLLAGGLLAWGARMAADRLVFDVDAISRDIGPRNLWRLRWQHMAAVRFGRLPREDESENELPDGPDAPSSDRPRDALWLVPLSAVAGHPEIAPALAPRPIDGVTQQTFEVPLGRDPKVWDAVHAAVLRHAPARLVVD
jgi:hypothetical protein